MNKVNETQLTRSVILDDHILAGCLLMISV